MAERLSYVLHANCIRSHTQ